MEEVSCGDPRGEYKRPPRKFSGVLRQNKQVLKIVMDKALAILKEEQEPTPTQEDLRKTVRAALRHVRRERAGVWIRDLLKPTIAGKEFLSTFCIRRLRELQQARWRYRIEVIKPSPITHSTAPSERLRCCDLLFHFYE
jgi:hypothetical protein